MSFFDKLSIQGVRSFGGAEAETIEIFTPLTLIVGYNGSGKTTLIECLKYATTGTQPPNYKGGSFIHDPALNSEKEVKARVQLRFGNTNNVKMTVSRRLQLTVKRNTRSMKTLEGSLAVSRNGERTTISSKVAELDYMVPQYLGVSKAILENVIFCHQDESLWPLSEPLTLKKKFDEIFEAQKYTKAIDNIKVLRKNQSEELRLLKQTEQAAKDDKDKGAKIEAELAELNKQHLELRQKVFDIEEELQHAMTNLTEASDQFATFQGSIQELETKRTERRIKQETVDEARSSIGKYLKESDEELQTMLEQHQERLDANDGEQQKHLAQQNELDQRVNALDHELGQKRSEHGRFQAEKNHYDTQVTRRMDLVKETAASHGVRGFEHDLAPQEVADFINRIARLAKDQQAALQRAERELKAELDQAQKHLNSLNTQKSTLRSNQDSAKSRIADTDRQIADQQRKLSGIDVDEGKKARLDSKVEDIESELRKAGQEDESTNLTQQIREAEERIASLEEQRSNLQSDLIKFNAQSQQSAKIDLLTKKLNESKRSLDTMMGAHSSRVSEALGSGQSWDANALEDIFRQTKDEKVSQAKEAERQQEGKSREHSQVDYKLRTARTELSKRQQSLQQHEKDIRAVIGTDNIDDYPDALQTVSESRDIAKADVDNFQALKEYYEKCINTLQKKNACRLCQRSFQANDPAKSKFHKSLLDMMKPETLKESEDELQKAQKDLDSVRNLSNTYDAWKKLSKTELPASQQEVASLEQQTTDLLAQLEKHDQIVADRQSAVKNLESLSKTVQSIAQDAREVSRCEAEIAELSQKQSQSGAPAKSLSDIQTQIGETENEIKRKRSQLNRLLDDQKASASKMTTLQVELRDTKAKLREAEYALEQRLDISTRIEELQALNKQVRDQITGIEQDNQSLGPQIAQAQAQVDDIESRGDEKQRELRTVYDRLLESNRSIEAASRDIIAYEQRNGHQQVGRSQREMTSIEEAKQEAQQQRHIMETKIAKLRDEKANEAEYQRVVRQNLKYRNGRRALEGLEQEIQELVQKNAEQDRDYWQGQVDKWQAERNRLSAAQAGTTAQMKSKDEQIQAGLRNWDEFYKGAKKAYKEAHIKVEATKAAVEDLGRYGSALDKAIMKYHSLKMEEINNNLASLWNSTYRGDDIDRILIRSDSEGATGARKSYNYRVCMVKQDVEMDMRGRCSAGQKVLASILIRLTLAETFGHQCGMIALDEPTTNLDRENIEALALQLHEVIKYRRAQSNFQLIVITHDEDFLRKMHCSDFAEKYYLVHRGNERGEPVSCIKKQNISLLMN